MIFLCDSYGQIGIGKKNLRPVLDFENSNSQILISLFSIFFTQEQYEQLMQHVHICISIQKTNDGQRNEYTCFVWAGGTFFPVVLLCRVSFWFWWEKGFGLHTHVLRVQYSCGVVLVFWLRREIVFGVTYILSVQYSCAVVSVFWLQREIVLKMRTCIYKKILLGYFIMIRQPMCVFYMT